MSVDAVEAHKRIKFQTAPKLVEVMSGTVIRKRQSAKTTYSVVKINADCLELNLITKKLTFLFIFFFTK